MKILAAVAETISLPLRVFAWVIRVFFLLMAILYFGVALVLQSGSASWQGLLCLGMAVFMTLLIHAIDRLTLWIRVQQGRWSY